MIVDLITEKIKQPGMTFHHAGCALVCLLHIYLLAEIFEDLRDLDLLRAYLFAAAAAYAGAWALVFRQCHQCKGGR